MQFILNVVERVIVLALNGYTMNIFNTDKMKCRKKKTNKKCNLHDVDANTIIYERKAWH